MSRIWQLTALGLILASFVTAMLFRGAVTPSISASPSSTSTPHLVFVESQRDGVGSVDGLGFVQSVTLSPDGQHVYAASSGDDAIAVFSRNSTTGALTFVENQRDGVGGVDGLDGANSVAVSADGNHLYAASWDDEAVAVFSRNTATGALTFVEVHKDGVGGVDGLNGALAVTISPDGKHLYAAGNDDNAVAVFSRNPTTGALAFLEFQKDGVGGVDGLSGAYSMAVTPDGKHLYVGGIGDDAVAVFSRNSTTGALTFLEVQRDGVAGDDPFHGILSMTISPGGEHLYVGAEFDNSVAVFSRDSTTGALTFVEDQRDGEGGVDGLFGPRLVTVSPDGKHLYAASWGDDAIAVFNRNSTTGGPDLC
jgi:6-phosphogluconolactonase (cycloisomerase 2 family)